MFYHQHQLSADSQLLECLKFLEYHTAFICTKIIGKSLLTVVMLQLNMIKARRDVTSALKTISQDLT
jgi:hypothetical protein